jgi:hypothetical protein
MMLKDHIERDPAVRQSIHEEHSFIKLQEGYPIFYPENEVIRQNKMMVHPGASETGILDIFESLSQVVKLVAISHHAVQELQDTHQPDNGLISSLNDLIAIEFIDAELQAVSAEDRGNQLV